MSCLLRNLRVWLRRAAETLKNAETKTATVTRLSAKLKAGAIKPDVVGLGGRWDVVEVGVAVEVSSDAGSDDKDDSRELRGAILTVEDSRPGPNTNDEDGDADGKSLDAGKTGSKTNVEGDGARFAGTGAISGGDESESNVSSPGGRCDSVKWGEMGVIGGASSDAGREEMNSSCDDSDNSGRLSVTTSAADAGVDDSSSQGPEDWLRDPNSDDD
ncbi:hypothetical protein EDB83DRAFT_2635175 [Lactarius deliciosus]|nr:hypothetical protein EDB83DRAFT_2635175 [Lactarius deliciosus]